MHHRLAHHRASRARRRRARVFVHQRGEQFLVERSPIGANPHRLAIFDRQFNDEAELLVPLVFETHIAGIDSIFVERLGAGRMLGEELMADIVEIADERDMAAGFREAIADMRHGGRRFGAIDGYPDKFGPGAGQRHDLGHGPLDVGCIRIGHGLDGDRGAPADHDCGFAGADPHADGAAAGEGARLVGVNGLREAGRVERVMRGSGFGKEAPAGHMPRACRDHDSIGR